MSLGSNDAKSLPQQTIARMTQHPVPQVGTPQRRETLIRRVFRRAGPIRPMLLSGGVERDGGVQ